MKFRQAKKIIKRELRKRIERKPSYYGWLVGSPQWMKAEIVYVHHMKKSHPRYFESRGIIKELRKIFEK